jgi:hypothetical protein
MVARVSGGIRGELGVSAFIVDRAHIDALVELALCGPRDWPRRASAGAWPPFYWHADDPQTGIVVTHELTSETCGEAGSMLIRECIASVACDYPDLLWPELPGPDPNPDPEEYVFPLDRALSGVTRPTAVEGLKILDCYECQSCGHAGWRDSSAQRFCDVLRSRLIRALPGYEEAPWGQPPARWSRSRRGDPPFV